MLKKQGCRFGPESSRQTLVNHQYLDPAEYGTICDLLFPKKLYRGQICNLVKWPNQNSHMTGWYNPQDTTHNNQGFGHCSSVSHELLVAE